MRISEWGWRGVSGLAIAVIMTAGVVIAALSAGEDASEAHRFTSVKDAYRAGVDALSGGDIDAALPALEFAAAGGKLGAQLRLTRIYGEPDGGHRNDAKALHYYHLIAKDHADIDRVHPAARHVSAAFRRLAQYYRSGVPSIALRPDANKTAQLLRHAASYFRDVEAQFEIGRMYAEGDGVAQNRRLAIRWLLKASQKRYAPAQAYLGEMLWAADAGDVMRARGLAFLALAIGNAKSAERGGIEQRYRQAGLDAKVTEIEQAERFVAAWDHLRASGATIKLTRLRPQAPYAMPDGSMIAPEGDFPSAKELVKALSQHLSSPFLWGPGTRLAEDEAIAHFPDSHPESDQGSSYVARKFLLSEAARAWDGNPSDPFAAVEHAKFGGETLSVTVDEAPQPAKRPASKPEKSAATGVR